MAGIWWVNFKKGTAANQGEAAKAPAKPSVENLQKGGVFQVSGFGERLDDVDLVVLDRHEYREKGYEWFELECESGSEKLWLNVERDDELEITVSTRRIRLNELGVSKEQLDQFDDEEEGSFTFEGAAFHYEDSGKATFYRSGNMEKGEKFYYWEFESEEDPRFIGVERWQDGSFEVHISESIRESRISVYSNSGEL